VECSLKVHPLDLLLNQFNSFVGTDLPNIDCVIMARPTRSHVLFQQMMGRGLRTFPGKENCMVIDVVDNMEVLDVATVPSLFGMRSDFDLEGNDVLESKQLSMILFDKLTLIFETSC
jgi:ATP-dependent helicase IRC3